MKIVRTKIPFLPPKGYRAITLGCFIFMRKGVTADKRLLVHEGIHWAQEKELLIIGFYLLYVLEFIFNLFRYGKWKAAYRNISFEREAKTNEMLSSYLEYRPRFAWRSYWKVW